MTPDKPRLSRTASIVAIALAVVAVLATIAVPLMLRSGRDTPSVRVAATSIHAANDAPSPAPATPEVTAPVPASATAPAISGDVPASLATCPKKYMAKAPFSLWVPHGPTAAGAEGRIVPLTTPRSAVLCKYLAKGHRLAGAKRLGGLDMIADDLQLPKKTDQPMAGCEYQETGTPYLLRLEYPTGVVWVTTMTINPSCLGSSNGESSSDHDAAADFAAAYDTATWAIPPRYDADPHCDGRFGRAGAEAALVPVGAVAIRACTPIVAGTGMTQSALPAGLVVRTTDPATISRVAALLAGAAEHGGASCRTAFDPQLRLAVDYPAGRSVSIRITTPDLCGSAASNGSAPSKSLNPAEVAELFALVR